MLLSRLMVFACAAAIACVLGELEDCDDSATGCKKSNSSESSELKSASHESSSTMCNDEDDDCDCDMSNSSDGSDEFSESGDFSGSGDYICTVVCTGEGLCPDGFACDPETAMCCASNTATTGSGSGDFGTAITPGNPALGKCIGQCLSDGVRNTLCPAGYTCDAETSSCCEDPTASTPAGCDATNKPSTQPSSSSMESSTAEPEQSSSNTAEATTTVASGPMDGFNGDVDMSGENSSPITEAPTEPPTMSTEEPTTTLPSCLQSRPADCPLESFQGDAMERPVLIHANFKPVMEMLNKVAAMCSVKISADGFRRDNGKPHSVFVGHAISFQIVLPDGSYCNKDCLAAQETRAACFTTRVQTYASRIGASWSPEKPNLIDDGFSITDGYSALLSEIQSKCTGCKAPEGLGDLNDPQNTDGPGGDSDLGNSSEEATSTEAPTTTPKPTTTTTPKPTTTLPSCFNYIPPDCPLQKFQGSSMTMPVLIHQGFLDTMQMLDKIASMCSVKIQARAYRTEEQGGPESAFVGHAITFQIKLADGTLCDEDCLAAQNTRASCFTSRVNMYSSRIGVTWSSSNPAVLDNNYSSSSGFPSLLSTIQSSCSACRA